MHIKPRFPCMYKYTSYLVLNSPFRKSHQQRQTNTNQTNRQKNPHLCVTFVDHRSTGQCWWSRTQEAKSWTLEPSKFGWRVLRVQGFPWMTAGSLNTGRHWECRRLTVEGGGRWVCRNMWYMWKCLLKWNSPPIFFNSYRLFLFIPTIVFCVVL